VAEADSSCAALRIFSDDLIPDEVTELLRCEPTRSQTKGQTFTNKRSGKQKIAKIGMWRLSAADCEPAKLDAQIDEIFQQLPSDLNVWNQLAKNYELDISCGLFLTKRNEVFLLEPKSMQILLSRTIRLDIYSGDE